MDQARDAYAPFDLLPLSSFGLRQQEVPVPGGSVLLLRTPATAARATVFLHGLNGSWRSWMPLLKAVDERSLALGDVVVVDMSRSRVPSSLIELQSLSGLLLGHLLAQGWEELDLVGHSTGGSLAGYMAAADTAGTIRSLRLISGLYVSLFDAARQPILKTDREAAASRGLARLRVAGALGPIGEVAIRRLKHSRIVRQAVGAMFAFPELLPPSVLDATADNYNAQALRDTVSMGRRYFPESIYPWIKAPTWLLFGAEDPLTTVADAETAKALLPQLVWRVVPETGHYAHIERPFTAVDFLWDL